MELNNKDREILKNHISNLDGDIYAVYNIPPEVVAVLFAYVSRSPAKFKENLLKLIKDNDLDINKVSGNFSLQDSYDSAKEKAKKFHEKWVVGYGHSSVAEHANVSIAIDKISVLAVKILEDSRLAAYTEKSSRYQVFDTNNYYIPEKIKNSKYFEKYKSTIDKSLNLYLKLVPIVTEHLRNKMPIPKNLSKFAYEAQLKAKALDSCRYLLPVSGYTSVGLTANARTLEHMITKLLSHPLEEVNNVGLKMKQEAGKIIPTLLKYANKNDYIIDTNKHLTSNLNAIFTEQVKEVNETVKIIDYPKNAENILVSSILYKYTNYPYEQAKEMIEKLSQEKKVRLVNDFLEKMTKHDWPMRELEHLNYTFDILTDYGAWKDIQRHRMATQTNQELTTFFGYNTPEIISEVGFEKEYKKTMDYVDEVFKEMYLEYPLEAQYIVPHGFKRRILFTWNLRELFHFIKLRSSPQGHISYRRIAQECYKKLDKLQPVLTKFMTVDLSEDDSWHS